LEKLFIKNPANTQEIPETFALEIKKKDVVFVKQWLFFVQTLIVIFENYEKNIFIAKPNIYLQRFACPNK
jgi:hypothetical protein